MGHTIGAGHAAPDRWVRMSNGLTGIVLEEIAWG